MQVVVVVEEILLVLGLQLVVVVLEALSHPASKEPQEL
jgi:hypothetical protein